MPVTRRPAVAGSWYPGTGAALVGQVERYLAAVADAAESPARLASVTAVVVPHAGLMYSGPVAAFAYYQLRQRTFDLIVLVGPSHFVEFDGVAVPRADGFDTPLGTVPVDRDSARALMTATTLVREDDAPHAREHSLEMQLPFLVRVCPGVPILPLVIGRQTAVAATALAAALAGVLVGRRPLLVASTDLSHYHDAATAAALDLVVLREVAAFAPDALQAALDRRPEHACGGGALVAVMRAARELGARDADVLRYADSGDVSGDKSSVVGYMAAAFGRHQA